MRERLLLRGQHPELPGPKLFRFDSSEGWYAEERIHGLPLNRLNNGRRIQEAINRAQQSMLHLYDQTSSEQGYREWKYSIIQQIDAAVEGLPAVYSESLRKQILSTVEMLSSVCFDVDVEGRIIETVQTHGDFQPANILIPTDSDQSSVYLIDWEYTAKRCRWYDALVFELHSRSPKGFADRVSQWLLDKHRAFQLIEWCGLDQTEFLPKFVVASFLLEDLLLRLGDATIPGLLQPNKGFLVFVDELSSVNLDSSL